MRIIPRPRRSMLYMPGNNPGMVQNCAVYGADGVLLDLEDAVALSEKDAARDLVVNALRSVDFGRTEKYVRLNGQDTEFFQEDLEAIVPACPDAVRLPKSENPDLIRAADKRMAELEEANGIPVGTVKIHAMIETAYGMMNAYAIATACERVTGLTLGGQDLAADLGVKRTKEGVELLYGRSHVALAAHAAGIEAFDTVFTDLNDPEGLLAESRLIAGLGFTGKAAIHPSQIAIIHEAWKPAEKDVVKAARVVRAAQEAQAQGLGVIALDGKMVDGPVIAQAQRVIELARISGMEVPE